MRTLLISDLHLGAALGGDLLRRGDFRERLFASLEGVDRLVLLGDAIELRDRPLADAVELARPFFDELGEALDGRPLVVVPGNHDHHLLEPWLTQRRLDGAGPLGLEERAPGQHLGLLGTLAGRMPRVAVELAYPGLWLRPGVYATHGHYLDRHLTIPTFERLAVAAVERALGGPPLPDEDPLEAPSGPTDPDEYEQALAPVYAFLFAVAQSATGDRVGNPTLRIWQALGGGASRSARIRGWLLGAVAVPGAVGVANRLGLGPVRADLSPGAITRAGVAAIGQVAGRLGVEAEHLIFGHTHRRGPLAGERGWSLPGGGRLWNTGSWVNSPSLLGPTAAESPYWPGTIAIVDAAGEPRLEHLLDGLSRADLDDASGSR